MRKYRNPESIGVTVCELSAVKPVTLKIEYGGAVFEFCEFMSLIAFEGVTEEDIGERYAVMMTSNNQVPYVLGKFKEYNMFYPGEFT